MTLFSPRFSRPNKSIRGVTGVSVTLLLFIILDPHQSQRSLAYTTSTSATWRRKKRWTALYAESNNYRIDEKKLRRLIDCDTGKSARRILSEALLGSPQEISNDVPQTKSKSVLYNSMSIPSGASDRPLSDAELGIQTNIRNVKYTIMDVIELNGDRDIDRASIAVLCLSIAGFTSALGAEQYLPGPEILRFVVVWLLSFSPLALLGFGITAPAELQSLFISIQRMFFPTYRKRMIYHEAGHFLVGHLLGLPVKKYQANAVKNAVEFFDLGDPNTGKEKSRMLGFDGRTDDKNSNTFDSSMTEERPFYSVGGRGEKDLQRASVARSSNSSDYYNFRKLPSKYDPTKSWPYRGFDHATLDILSVVSVAGVCSEILAFGNAEGGYADLSQLRQFFSYADPALSEREQENRIRFALGYAMSLIRRHLKTLDVLVEAMEKNSDIVECITAIEMSKDANRADIIDSTYERRRRDKIRTVGVGMIESIFLGGKNINTVENDILEGKGGGDRKQRFQLSGDDSLYAAMTVSLVFLIWASSGGLTLH